MCALKKNELIEKMNKIDLNKVYKYSCNTTTMTSDKGEKKFYSEIMAEYVLSKKENIEQVVKDNSWKIEPSKGLSYFSKYRTNIEQAIKEGEGAHFKNDDEKIICRQLYIKGKSGTGYDGIGKIIDFETPLAHLRECDKEPYKTREVGKVDLISYLKDEKTIWLLEAKKGNSKESMYRCVMEGFTYLQTIDKERFIEDFNQHITEFGKIDGKTTIFKTAPLIAYNREQYKEMEEAKETSYHEKLLELMRFLDVTVYFSYQINGDKAIIRRHTI